MPQTGSAENSVASFGPRFSLHLMVHTLNRIFIGGNTCSLLLGTVLLLPFALLAPAQSTNDWPQFRGPGALGRNDAKGFPLTWSDITNIVWKAPLPGPGASSPIVIGDRVFITCFTGYAASAGEPGEMANLKRHLLCLNLADGRIRWDAPVPATLPEQERIREDHGYASSTPDQARWSHAVSAAIS